MTYLLDVNLLIALVDSHHVSHDLAHEWFEREGRLDWATCPITENGLVRILSQQRYPNVLGTAGAVVELMRGLRGAGCHSFWPDEISLLDSDRVELGRLSASAQVTDTYLLALAVHRGGRLATLDRRLSPAAVRGGAEALALIG